MGERLTGAALAAHITEIKDRVRLSDVIGRSVKLRRAGREFVGLSPFTREKTASFTIHDDKQFYHCFSSGKHGDLFDWLREGLGLDFGAALEEGRKLAGLSDGPVADHQLRAQKQRQADRDKQQAADLRRRRNTAAEIWSATLPGAGHPLIEGYLRDHRALDLDVIGGVPEGIRFHPRLRNKSGHRFPAMVTRVPNVVTGEGTAVHLTFLRPDGSGKISKDQGVPKQIRGAYFGHGVCLAAFGLPTAPIYIGEGIESVLAAAIIYRQARRTGAFWAALSLGNLTGRYRPLSWRERNTGVRALRPDPEGTAFVPPGIDGRPVVILAEDDLKPMDGPDGRALSGTERAKMMFALAAAKFEQAGAAGATIAWPPQGCDFNDILLNRAREAQFQEDLRYA